MEADVDAESPLRCILHVDMDAFFASVEQHDHPELRGKPVVVGSGPHERGVVSTASYEARMFGIHSAMPSREAYRRCPHAIFVPVNGARYHEVSAQIFSIFERYTPFIEGLSCDEAFLDVTGSFKLFGDGETIGSRIRADITRELGLTASVGVATNKFLAKIGSEMKKPDGLTLIPSDPEGITAFLAPLPIRKIFGIGKTTGGILETAGIRTIGDIQRGRVETLTRLVGESGALHLRNLAFGLDDRPVETEREEKSISREYTFSEDEKDPEIIRAVLMELATDVGRQIREASKFATTGKLKLRWSDFTTLTRQQGFEAPSCDDFTFRELAHELLEREKLNGRHVRLVGFGVTGLSSERITQPSLFSEDDDKRRKRESICQTLDNIRQNLDGGAIGFAGSKRSCE